MCIGVSANAVTQIHDVFMNYFPVVWNNVLIQHSYRPESDW